MLKNILLFLCKFICWPIKLLGLFTRYSIKHYPILAIGMLAFLLAFILVAGNALFIQETKAGIMEGQPVVVTKLDNDEPKKIKKPKKLNKYAFHKATHTILRLSRKEAKKLMRHAAKKAKSH